mgnify:CR=1 FL=1
MAKLSALVYLTEFVRCLASRSRFRFSYEHAKHLSRTPPLLRPPSARAKEARSPAARSSASRFIRSSAARSSAAHGSGASSRPGSAARAAFWYPRRVPAAHAPAVRRAVGGLRVAALRRAGVHDAPDARTCLRLVLLAGGWRLRAGHTRPAGRYTRIVVASLSSPLGDILTCLLYTSPSPRDKRQSRMPCSA